MLIDLEDEQAEDPGLTGAKAAWLARGLRAGLPVLPGAVVPTSASADAMQRGVSVMAQRGSGGARLSISQASLDPGLSHDLIERSRPLGDPLVVRSSSVLEGGGEWSGAFTSYLDIHPDETPVAVKGCWASAFTVHALERYEAAGLEPGSAPMAVLIQRTLDPQFGGTARLVDDEVTVVGVVGSPAPLVQGWDPGVYAKVSPDGTVKGADALAVIGVHVLGAVADVLRQAERMIGANSCEWAFVDGEVTLLQLMRSETRAGTSVSVSADFKGSDMVSLAQLVRRFPGPLGEELVLPWAIAAPELVLESVVPMDIHPLEAFAEAQQQARSLTAEVWGGRKATAVDRAQDALRELRGDQPTRALDMIAGLRPPDTGRVTALLALLARVRQGLMDSGAISQLEIGWHVATAEVAAILGGRSELPRSRIGFDRWEPFDAAVVLANGASVEAVPAASGIGVGRLCFVDDSGRAIDFRPRDVVVGLRPTPKLAPLLWDASALITTGGGPAAHLFESARALAIPAVAAVDLAGLLDESLSEASGRFTLAVDGTDGRVYQLPW